jgi:hypothetical protein
MDDPVGESDRYEAAVVCVNCGYCGPCSIAVGTDVWGATCPLCQCHGRLRPDNQAWHDERIWTRVN